MANLNKPVFLYTVIGGIAGSLIARAILEEIRFKKQQEEIKKAFDNSAKFYEFKFDK